MNKQEIPHYECTLNVLSDFTQDGTIIIANIDDDLKRAEAIQWFCEAMYRIATGLGAKPEDLSWTQTQAIDAHVIYMTDYVNEVRKMNELIEKRAGNARNN